jgi:hypothetical protein
MRVGGSRGPLRFDRKRVMQAMERRRVDQPAGDKPRRRPGPRRKVAGVELLPLPKEAARRTDQQPIGVYDRM